MNAEPTTSHPRRWDPWPISIIGFFAVAIIGCLSLVVFCSRHPAELVASDYYEQEIHYQGQMDGKQRAQQQGQEVALGYDAATRMITVSLPSAQSHSNVTGTIHLYRPSSVSLDRRIKFDPSPDGVQTIDAASLQPGLWKVRFSWTVNDEDYFTEQQLKIPRFN
jgi:nitrogen fixation protein FixH